MPTPITLMLSLSSSRAVEAGIGKMQPVDVMSGAHKQESFLAINPYGQVPAAEDAAAGVKLGESHVRARASCICFRLASSVLHPSLCHIMCAQAILRYLANMYCPELYPKEDPKACAHIDWAMDSFASYVYPAHVKVVYTALGFAGINEDQPAANKAYAEALRQWASIFLSSGRFINGNVLSIAGLSLRPADARAPSMLDRSHRAALPAPSHPLHITVHRRLQGGVLLLPSM